MAKKEPYPALPGFMRLSQVLDLIPVSKSAWWDGCNTGRYPKPLRLGPRTTVWRTADIYALIDQIEAENADKQTG